MARPILFLSDYGEADGFAGVCRAVIARDAPDARVIDITHGIPPGDIRRGALLLLEAAKRGPQDAVYLAIVDPGVGTDRRGIAVEAGKAHLVGPDNGLLSLATRALGGASRAVSLRAPEDASATFHGRDVFAPAAAWLASGLGLEDLGADIDADSLATVRLPGPRVEPGRLTCRVLAVDRFGNVTLAALPEALVDAGLDDVPDVLVQTPRGKGRVRRARTFADVPERAFALIVDSFGWLAIVRNRGSAAKGMGVAPGDPVALGRPE